MRLCTVCGEQLERVFEAAVMRQMVGQRERLTLVCPPCVERERRIAVVAHAILNNL